MANPLVDQSLDGYLRAISTVNATAQVILNRQISAPSDNYYTVQAALNIGAGRSMNALSTQAALKANTGFTGQGSIQDILAYALANNLTMSKITIGV